MNNFKRHLEELVAPKLAELGYHYDGSLRQGHWLHGFRKQLTDDIQNILLFQRSRNGADFTVELVRCKTVVAAQWYRGDYEGFLRCRLPWLLWFVYKLRLYPSSDYWWHVSEPADAAVQFADALAVLVKYGIPWLEDLSSRFPGGLPEERMAEFREALSRVVVPELAALGYPRVPGVGPLRFGFAREVTPGIGTSIEFLLSGRPDSDELFFLVRLSRSRDPEQYAGPSAHYAPLEMSLDILLQRFTGLRLEDRRSHLWTYTTKQELEDHLVDATGKLAQYGIPWLEDPVSVFLSS